MSAAVTDLVRGCSVAELVPGDADGVDRLAQQMLGFRDLFGDAAQALGRIEVAWSGAAADAFRGEFHLQPTAFSQAAAAFSDASFALGSHALALDSARAMAASAIELWQSGMRAAGAAAAVTGGPAAAVMGPVGDGALLEEPAGSEQRLAAVEKLDRARDEVRRSGDKAAAALRSAVADAPESVSAWQHLLSFAIAAPWDINQERQDYAAGAVMGLADTGFVAGSAGNPVSLMMWWSVKEQANDFAWAHGIDPRSRWYGAGSVVVPTVVTGFGGAESAAGRLVLRSETGLLDTAATKPANVLLYRGMQADVDGLPKVGNTAKTLGVRTEGVVAKTDIDPDALGVVWPKTGGMSANVTIESIPEFRKPLEFGGTAKNLTVYSISSDDLDTRLVFVPDREGHGTVQPTDPMSLEQYRDLLAGTRRDWRKVEHEPRGPDS